MAGPSSCKSPRDAIARGIGMVYQHFMLVDLLTVAENAMSGSRTGSGSKLSAAEAELAQLAEQSGLDVDPDARVWQFSVGEQQRVEIIRLLFRAPDPHPGRADRRPHPAGAAGTDQDGPAMARRATPSSSSRTSSTRC